MRLTYETMKTLNTGFKTAFNQGWTGAERTYDKIAMEVKSSSASEAYAWLRQLPNIREWLGDRVIHSLSRDGFTLKNRTFESTISVKRTEIEDDTFGTYAPIFNELGRKGAEFPDELLAELIESGFTTNCYDGQYFFDTDHPGGDPDAPVSVSNMQAGAGPAWYLLDLSRNIRPFIFQNRLPFELQSMDQPTSEQVFMQDEYRYGLRGRMNMGFGLWQLAYASKAALTADNYESARAAMSSLRGENNRKLGVKATHLVVPSELEGDGRRVLKTLLTTGGESNPWVDSAELIVSQWI